ncbi:Glycoside hydrolase, family 43 [Niveomyces insectorum RCEF 264]|uniref:Glycoside hydrolase, family 43 n=1 Tax=Niveomyces insectorum RCEF 264 TaxID=1081102 RepID=A0A162IFE2_9HYPO|nr:Glycoside hydrolase, family 43 [Niveomyces insectorum RCEF 264]
MPLVRNPILPGFNADPSVLRVGADYYIATSTFEWYPGVQIHHSTDLANWSLVARPLQRAAQLDLRGDPDSCGVWAPCLTHDGARFWLVYSDVKRKDGSFKDALNYIVHAPAIEGPWSDPVFANASGFDPSLFHDPDTGTKWFVNMLWDHRRRTNTVPPGGSMFAGIALQEFDPAAGRLVGPRRTIYRGTALGLVEGPHLYKRHGVYYLLTAEGGTGYDHAVTVARSQGNSIWGPYETHPDRYLVTSKDQPLAALQRAGHGDLVDSPDGSATYLVHLTGRPTTQRRRCVLGRETAIQTVRWGADGSSSLTTTGPVPSLYVDLPGARDDDPATSPYWQEQRYTFGDDDGGGGADYSATNGPTARRLHRDFQWLRTPHPERLFAVTGGQLVLYGRESVGSWFEQALVARRQTHFSFDAETVLAAYAPHDCRQFAGLTVYYCRYNFFYLAVTTEGDGDDEDPATRPRQLQILTSEASYPEGNLQVPLAAPVPLPATGDVRLAVTVRGRALQFWYGVGEAAASAPLTKVGPVYDASIVSDECGGHLEHGSFTGSFVGMAASDINGTALPARFDYFVYRPAHDATDRYDV